MAARQTSDIFVRLNLENVEGIDKLKSAFRDLDKTLGVSNSTIETARQRINEYVAGTTRSEQVIRGQISALQGLRSQVDLNGRGYAELTAEINQLQTELRGSTDAVERQRQALLGNFNQNERNVRTIREHVGALTQLQTQARANSSAFIALGADIEAAADRLANAEQVLSTLRSVLTRGLPATGAAAQRRITELDEGIRAQQAIIDEIDLRTARERALVSAINERAEAEESLNRSLLDRRQLAFQESARAGRQEARTAAAAFSNAPIGGTGFLSIENIERRIGGVPNTIAGINQELGEMRERLNNAALEGRDFVAVLDRIDALNRQLRSATTEFQTPRQQARAAVQARIEAQREQLRQSGFAAFSADISGPDFERRQQRETYTQAQQALADLNAAQDAMEAAVRRHQTTLTDIEVGAEQYRQDRLGQLNDAKIAASDATFKRELAQFDAALQQRDKIERRRNLMGAALGLGPQDRSPFYERVVGLSSAALEAQQAFMGRSPSEVYNDIAKSFSQGARTTLLDRNSEQVGQALGQGVEQGLVATTTKAADTFADRWLAAIKARFGIRSPSKVTEQEIGVPLGQGIGLGLVKGLNSVKAQIQSTLRTITAVSGLGTGPLGRAPLPSQGSRFSAQPIPRSQVADEVQAFLVRMAASPTSARRLTRIIGEDIKTSPALSVAMERSMYEKGLGPYRPFIRGAGASPEDIRFDEELFRGRRTRRGLRGDPNFPPMPGYGLEQLLERQATAIAGRTGAFLGPLGAPLRTTATPPASLAPTIAGVIQALDRNRVMPVFRGASAPPPSPTTGAAYSMGSAPFAFPLSGPLAAAGVSGRRAASRSVTESAANYRRALDAVWESDASAFVKLRDIISSRVQLQAGVLARRLTETRTSLDAAAGETSKAAGLPAATFRRLRAEIRQARETVRRENAVMDASEGRTSLGGFPLEGMLGPSSELGRISAATSMFGAGGGGGGRPPTTPTGPRPGDLSPDIRKLKTELLDFGPVAERSTASLQELRSVLQGQRELAAPGAAGTAMRREFDQVIAASEAMDKRIERELDRRNRSRRRLSGFQMAQIGGAAFSGGIFGGPEGLVGGVLGGAFGGVGGAFAGAAAGAQVGMLRQQLGQTSAYAAEIGKLQIALRGVSGSQANYNQAISAAAAVTRELNVPQREATAGITRLSAAVLGAGGQMSDATFAFRAISESIKATGGNAEQVDGALLALTQVFSKGKVSAEELNQIAERLPGTFTLFAKATGKSGPELQKALQQGQVGLNDLMKFLELASSKHGQTALKIAASNEEAGARMTIAFQKMALEVGNALKPIGAQIQTAFAKFATDITPQVVDASKGIGGLLKTIVDNGAAIAALTKLGLYFGGVTLALNALAAAQGPFKTAMLAIQYVLGNTSMAAARAAVVIRAAAATIAAPIVITIAIVGAELVIDYFHKIRRERDKLKELTSDATGEEWLRDIGGSALDRARLTAATSAVGKRYEVVSDELIKVNRELALLEKSTDAQSQYAGQTAIAASVAAGPLEARRDRLQKELNLLESRYQAGSRRITTAPTTRPGGSGFPDPTGTGDDDKAKRDKATSDAQRTAETLAQQEIRLANAVFQHKQDLERQRYELAKELLDLETKNRLDQMGAVEREAAQALQQRQARETQFAERMRALNERIAKAQQDLASAQRMAAVTGGAPGGRNYSNVGGVQGGRQMLHGIPGYAGYDSAHATPTNIHYHFSGKSPQETLAVANYLKQQGYQITEFGGMGQRVGRHAAGSQHYRNNAFDIGGASLGRTDSQIQAGLKRVHALINGFLTTTTSGPTGAQGRRGIVDTGDVALAQAELQALRTAYNELIESKGRWDAAADTESVNALTKAFSDQNQELQNTLRTDTLRAELQSKGYTAAQIDLEMKLADALDRRNRTLSEIPLSASDAIEAVNAKYRTQVDLLTKIYDLNQANANSFGFREGAQRYVESIGTMREATASLTEQGFRGLEDVIFQLTTTGAANFQAFAASILQQTARMIIQQLVLKTIMQAIGAIGGGGGGGGLGNYGLSIPGVGYTAPSFQMAKGGVLAANGIVPYATGGIVNRPTLFPFANGGSIGTGLMGEAGPEAIIPLQRGANGKLGVAGGGGTTNVVVNVDASGGTAVSGDAGQAKQLGQAITAAVQAELIKQRRPGGLLAG